MVSGNKIEPSTADQGVNDNSAAAPVSITSIIDGNSTSQPARFKGPLSAKRSCTDLLCFFLFLIVLIGFIAVTLTGIFIGNPFILFMGHDSTRQMCGVGSLHQKMHLLTFDPIGCIATAPHSYMTAGCSPSICVDSCPTDVDWNWPGDANKTVAQLPFLAERCQSGTNTELTIGSLVLAGKCPPYIFPSKSFVYRCEPAFLTDGDVAMYNKSINYRDAAGSTLKTDEAMRNLETAHYSMPFINDMLRDLGQSWLHLLTFTGITMFISFIWIVLLRFLGPCLIWISVILIVFGTGATSAFCWIIYDALLKQQAYALGVIPMQDLSYVPGEVWLAIGLVTTFLFLILLVVFCALFNRIRLAAAIVSESSRAVAGSVGVLFWPLLPFCLQLGFLALFIFGMFYFLTATSNSQQDISASTLEANIRTMWPVLIALLFAWFWITNFVLALSYVTLAGSFSSWYWNHGTDDSETCQLLSSVGRAARYHLGTLAFGSLVIAIVQLIRAVMQFFQRQFRRMRNPIGFIMLRCLVCCIWCVEKLLKFITKNAYILVALKGKHFCLSARKAFKLTVTNSVRLVVLDSISSVLITISIFLIVAGVAVVALFVFCPTLVNLAWLTTLSPPVRYFYIPLVVEIIASLVAALCFFSVYKMAIDTIFLNIMYDLKYNDGTAEKPYRATKSLLGIVRKKKSDEKATSD